MAVARNAEGFVAAGRAGRVANGGGEGGAKGGKTGAAAAPPAAAGAAAAATFAVPVAAAMPLVMAQPAAVSRPTATLPAATFQPAAVETPRLPTAPDVFVTPGLVKQPPGLELRPDIFRPELRPDLIRPDLILPTLPPLRVEPPSKTATQLAEAAIEALNAALKAVLDEAMNTIRNRNIAPAKLMDRLERRVKVGEVLNVLSKDWSDETKGDFAEAFGTTTDKLAVMDAIVSLAVLNDPELDDEIRGENTPESTTDDLLDRHIIGWQSHPAGTPLQWPYLLLVAVQRVDLARAEDVVKSIMDRLTTVQGFRLPKTAAAKLT